MIRNLTDKQIETRLTFMEATIAACRDTKSLPSLNLTYQKLINEQVRRDLERVDAIIFEKGSV